MNYSGIYLIYCIATDKYYIGSAININKRLIEHKTKLRNQIHVNAFLQNAWNKYGEDNFTFAVLQKVDNKNDLIKIEQIFLDTAKCYNREIGYNICSVAGNNIGIRLSEEAKKKISKANKGRIVSAETRARMSAWQKGKPKSKEFILKSIESRKGYITSEETKKKISINSRKIDKWPHVLGFKCKCEECRAKQRAYYRLKSAEYSKRKKAKFVIIQNNNFVETRENA